MTSPMVATPAPPHMPEADESDLFGQKVTAQLVHRSSISEIILTGYRAVDPEVILIGAQWPRAHVFYGPIAGRHDPLLLAESVRQAGLLVGHAELGVPYGHCYLLHDLWFELGAHPLTVERRPSNVIMYFTCLNVRRRAGRLGSMGGEAKFYRDGKPLGRAGGSFTCLSPGAYARLRGAVPPSLPDHGLPAPMELPDPVDPALVGRERAEDVVLADSPEPGTWLLRVNQDHPILFDHPLDHVPGMLVMEAGRQVARLLHHPVPAQPVQARAEFHRYIELDRPCTVRAHRETDATLRVTLEQSGAVAAAVRVTPAAYA